MSDFTKFLNHLSEPAQFIISDSDSTFLDLYNFSSVRLDTYVYKFMSGSFKSYYLIDSFIFPFYNYLKSFETTDYILNSNIVSCFNSVQNKTFDLSVNSRLFDEVFPIISVSLFYRTIVDSIHIFKNPDLYDNKSIDDAYFILNSLYYPRRF